jgi:hypothetical protein
MARNVIKLEKARASTLPSAGKRRVESPCAIALTKIRTLGPPLGDRVCDRAVTTSFSFMSNLLTRVAGRQGGVP